MPAAKDRRVLRAATARYPCGAAVGSAASMSYGPRAALVVPQPPQRVGDLERRGAGGEAGRGELAGNDGEEDRDEEERDVGGEGARHDADGVDHLCIVMYVHDYVFEYCSSCAVLLCAILRCIIRITSITVPTPKRLSTATMKQTKRRSLWE